MWLKQLIKFYGGTYRFCQKKIYKPTKNDKKLKKIKIIS